MASDNDILHRLYYEPDSAASFSGIDNLYRVAKEQGHTISRNTIRKWLATQKIYTLNRRSISKFARRRTIIPFQFYMYDVDNAYMKDYTKENDGYGYFILAIDDFSKRVFTRPVKQLNGPKIKEALQSILKESKTLPMLIRTDGGSEFVNSVVKAYLKKQGIKHIVTKNSTKTAFGERAIFTIKRRLLQAMISQKKKRWLELLPKITSSYNDSYHRTIGMKPNDVTKDKEVDIWNRVYWPKEKLAKRKANKDSKKKDFKFNIGETVKVTLNPYKYDRGYNKRFSDENFLVTDRSMKQGKEAYGLKDMKNDEILGSFYQQQLQRVTPDDNDKYEIEKVLKSRNHQGKKQFLVKWAGWDRKFNSWIDADTVEKNK